MPHFIVYRLSAMPPAFRRNERDAPYVLDGLLYNESDLELEEHYTDTHGYTEINFAAFAMKRRFADFVARKRVLPSNPQNF